MTRQSSPSDRPTGLHAAQALKAELAARIVTALNRQGLTVREAHARTGHAAADFSRLRGGQLGRFTVERLLGIAEGLGERLSLSLIAVDGGSGPAAPAVLLGHLRGLRILCRRYSVRRLGAFGSVLRNDFDSKRSDIDLTVEFGRSARYGPADQYFKFKEALEKLLRREVDLVELSAMPASRLKKSIELSRVSVYEQAA